MMHELLVPSGMIIVGFILLFKSADLFIDGAIGVAEYFKLPKMLTGIVLVAFATTAPEFTVSLLAAIQGFPEIALGNAVGSVICDDAVAMGLAAFISASPIMIDRRILLTSGIFLIAVDLLAFFFAFDGTVSRIEGILLLVVLAGYFVVLYRTSGREKVENDADSENASRQTEHGGPDSGDKPLKRLALVLGIGLTGIVIASEILIHGATTVCSALGIPEVIVGMTVVAIGTSLPEIAMCITAALRGEGELAAGDIIGADILNVLWIIGASSTANPIHVEQRIILFAFPYMILVVVSMLGLMWMGNRLTRLNGIFLFILYIVYIACNIILFGPAG